MPRQSLVSQAIKKVEGFAQIYEYLKEFNRMKRNDEITFDRYAAQLAKFCIKFGCFPDQVSPEDFVKYYNTLLESNPSGGTMKLAVYGVKMYFDAYGKPYPLHAVPVIKTPKRVPTYLTEDEVMILVYSGETRMDKIIFGGLYAWGTRAEEFVNLKIEDIDLEAGMLGVREGKGKKDRFIPTPKLFNDTLKDYIETAKPQTYLIETEPGKPANVNYLRYRLKKAVIKSEIKKRIYLHLFRSTYAIHSILNGVNIYSLAKYMGHASIVTTARYLKAIPDHMYGKAALPFDKVFTKENRVRMSTKRYDLFIQ